MNPKTAFAASGEALLQDVPVLLHEFFENAVNRWPGRIAVEIPPGRGRNRRNLVTYTALSEQAAAVANELTGLSGPGKIVAILLPRNSERLYSAQIGVLQTGGAYTCLDTCFPDERIAEILKDASAAAVLTDGDGPARVRQAGYTGRVVVVDELSDVAVPPVMPDIAPDDLAYVIYTSGTTGRPKGVMIEHRAIVNLVASDVAEFQLSPEIRVAQNSAAAYDSSVEEIWLAFSAGGTLVVMDDETVRLGPDLASWLRREKIALFCPSPTMLRSMGCADPKTELPDLSMIYTGGEALPQDLADRWSGGRVLINGYGPTECAVTATRTRIEPGRPVSIGRPISGVMAWVLNPDLEEAGCGEWGELCLGGAGLARGYRNLPGKTLEKFIEHPRLGRIYRTGDLASRSPEGDLFYHGRMDTQVKIRGYRIELEEIEMRLAECPGVRGAACTVQDGSLAAFLVPEDGQAPAFHTVDARLRQVLPDYMVPSRYGVLPELPLTTAGKLNRAVLPKLDGLAHTGKITAPRNALESRLVATVCEVLELDDPVTVEADFFTDLGGNSLRAAQLVSRLRQLDPATAVTVRDVYETRTIAALAPRLAPIGLSESTVKPKTSRPSTVPATIVQTVWLLLLFFMGALATYWGVFDLAPELLRGLGLLASVLLTPILLLAGMAIYTPAAVAIAVLAKKFLIGRYRPMRAPVWGSFYVRNWMVQTVVRAIPWWLIDGTGLQVAALRALGARIGRGVHIHRGVDLLHGGWDLLDIGDCVTLSQESMVGLVELEDGDILIRPVWLGASVTLDIRAGVSGDTRLEAGSSLTPLSWLPPGNTIPANERWDGIPARPSGYSPAVPAVSLRAVRLTPAVFDILMVSTRCVLRSLPFLAPEVIAVVAAQMAGIDAERIARWLDEPALALMPLLAAFAFVVFSTPVTLALEACLVRALGPVPEGVIDLWSLAYLRVRLKTETLESAGEWLGGALMWPVWLRAAGMRLGRGCEISSILDTVPELVEIGAKSFLADGIYIGGPRIDRGTVTLAPARLGSGVYLGNHVVVPAGRTLPDGVLLGVATVVSESMAHGGSWFGLPPFELPRREVVEYDKKLTYRPNAIRYATRLFWETLRLALPIPEILAALLWLGAVSAAGSTGSWWKISATVCLAGLAVEAGLCLAAVAAKWALVGRVQPGQHPFWACWCGRWDYMFVAWEAWARPTLTYLEGSLLLSWFLRTMGMKIGKRVVLGPGFAQVVDPDMLILEDDSTVNAMFQAHTFEDRVLKLDYIRVRRGATVGGASVPLYGADIGAGAYVAPHSVVMKQEQLLPGLYYQGAPTQADTRRALSAQIA